MTRRCRTVAADLSAYQHTSCQSWTQTKSQSSSWIEFCLTVRVQLQEPVSADWSFMTRWWPMWKQLVEGIEGSPEDQLFSLSQTIHCEPQRNIWTRLSINTIYQRFNLRMLLKSSPYWHDPFRTKPSLKCTHSQRVLICSGANQPQLRRRISNPYGNRATGCRSIYCGFHFRELSCRPSLFSLNVQQGFALAAPPINPQPALPLSTDGEGP